MTPEEGLWNAVFRHAERDLRVEHAHISLRSSLVTDIIAGRVRHYDQNTRTKVIRLHDRLRIWREARSWFMVPKGSFKTVCELLDLDPAAVRERLWGFLHFKFNASLADAAFLRYRKAAWRARAKLRGRAKARSKATPRLVDKSGAAVPRVPGSDAASARRANSVRGAEEAGARAAPGSTSGGKMA